MHHIKTIEGNMEAKGLKIAIIATRFNDFLVNSLVGGAVDYLLRHGAKKDDLVIIKIPGAFELPVVAKKVASVAKYDGIIALGAVIRGATPHFEFVASEASKGLAHIALDHNIPIGFGLLTTDNIEQAIERSGTKAGNKGAEAAAALLETLRVMEQI